MSMSEELDYSAIKRRSLIKRLMPQTLFFRSLVILITPIFLIQIVLTVVFFDRHWSRMTSRLAFAVAGEISFVVDYIEHEKDAQQTQKIMNGLSHHLDLLVSFQPQGKLVENSQENPRSFSVTWEQMIKQTLSEELGKAITQNFSVNVDFSEKWIDVSVQTMDGIVYIQVPQRRLFSSTTYIFLLWVFATSAVLLIIAVLFMRNQIRPIYRLSAAAERLGKGHDVQNFKIEGASEVRQAGQAFLDMKTRIQRQVSQRTDMLAGVSHDLRTPLTRLKLQVAMMGDSPDVYEMERDIHDMEKMIEGYLNFVRGEGREKTKSIKVTEVLKDATISAKRQGCDVTLDLGKHDYTLMVRPVALKRCLSNIVSNAIKYADHIWISLASSDSNNITIVIEDNGPGIHPDQYEEVFRPFYRLDSSRNIETGGTGLGLPIAMDIIHSHGGEIWLDKSSKGGLAVYVTLPI